MPAATLTTKGQLVIPQPIRQYMHLHPGDRLDFVINDDGDVVIRPLVSDVTELKGMLRKAGRKPVSVREMNKGIRERAGRSS